MKTILPEKTFEFEVVERRIYVVQGDGRTEFEAQQDAIERFHRLQKSRDLTCLKISKPEIVKTVKRK